MEATLIAHRGAVEVTRAQLVNFPPPPPQGRWHLPLDYGKLVTALHDVLPEFHLKVAREQYAVQAQAQQPEGETQTPRHAMRFFATLDLVSENGLGEYARDGLGFALGIRGSNDQMFALQMGAGQRVFVCDNLAFSSDLIALTRKQTTGFDPHEECRRGLVTYLERARDLVGQIDAARAVHLTPAEAKVRIFDAFFGADRPILAHRYAPAVAANYFHPPGADCEGETLWALHNAFTRECRALSPSQRFTATARLGTLLRVGEAGAQN